jgi:hypothetical protein
LLDNEKAGRQADPVSDLIGGGTGSTGLADANQTWNPWCVAPSSGFEVDDPHGNVGLIQVDAENFLVTTSFRFSDRAIEKLLVDQLVANGRELPEATAMVDDARTYPFGTEGKTDMASIPRFLRWFENTYGVHTLAAIIHDRLITSGEPNTGAMKSDTLADRFFRLMMGSAGVPWLKRWIIWSAVALRTRWYAGGVRRLSLAIWLLLAAVGISAFVSAAGSAVFGWGHLLNPWLLLVIALVLPALSAPLWGKQLGASFVAAAAALWILPASLLAALAYLTYRLLELLSRKLGLTEHLPR